jgi:ribonuclease P protein component
MSALPHTDTDQQQPAVFERAGLRFGITVSRRQARRAVARNAVKRVLRESARLQSPVLEAALADRQIDILFRLKAPLPAPVDAGWSELKRQLRREADSLLAQLLATLRAGEAIAGAPYRARAERDGQRPKRGPAVSLAQSTSAPQVICGSSRPEAGAAAQAQPGARPAATAKPAGT